MKIPPGLCRNPPANPAAIASCEKSIGKRLPADYLELLGASNGGEGFIGENYLQLWRIEELVELNNAYGVAEWLTDSVLLFGSNGGDVAYGFEHRDGAWTVMQVPFIGMHLDELRTVAQSFAAFIELLAGDKRNRS